MLHLIVWGGSAFCHCVSLHFLCLWSLNLIALMFLSFWRYLCGARNSDEGNDEYDMWSELNGFARAIDRVEAWLRLLHLGWRLDGVAMSSMRADLSFLYIFVAYASSSYDTKLVSIFTKVNAFKAYLQKAFIQTTPPKSLDVFTYLNQEIGLLKADIRASSSPQPFNHRHSLSYEFNFFFDSLLWNIKYLSEEKLLSDPLRMQMQTLERIVASLHSLYLCTSVVDDDDDDNLSPWKKRLVDHIGGVILQVAHLCCLCWCNAPLDQSLEEHVSDSLSDFLRHIDPATPHFLDITLDFLQPYDEEQSEKCISHFLHYMLGLEDPEEVVHREFVHLVTCLIKTKAKPDQSLNDIRNVIIEARNLQSKSRRAHKTQFALLFAKIWSLKAEDIITTCITNSSKPLDYHKKALENYVTDIQEGSSFLLQIVSPMEELVKRSVEYQLSKVIERVSELVLSLFKSFDVKEAFKVSIKLTHLYFQFQVQILILNAKALLLESLEKKTEPNFEILLGELLFLADVAITDTKEITEDEKLVWTDFEVVACGIISLCNSFLDGNVMTHGLKNVDVWVVDLLKSIQHLIPKLRGIYLRIPTCNFPKVPGLSFIEFLSQNLRDLLNRDHHDLLASVVLLIEAISSDLESIISEHGDDLDPGFGEQICKDVHTWLIDKVHLAEYVIDLIVLGDDDMRSHLVLLHFLSEEFKLIKLQLNHSNSSGDHGDHYIPQLVVSQVSTPIIHQELVVGLKDLQEDIICRLTRGTKSRYIVSIVGMPGIGKTTMAGNVFCSLQVTYHFYIRAWSCVSNTYRKRDVLLSILSQIISITDSTHEMDDDTLQSMLYRKLKGNKYLIVMDDMWNTMAWDDLHLSFPDDSNGSRILVTSRHQDMISKISEPVPLRELSKVESWELLKGKICQDQHEEYSQELLTIGKEIAKNCKGLPLAIVAIAGLLKRTSNNPTMWKEIAENVSSAVVNDSELQCREILELSYKYLPDRLKACFLYVGAFPEDKVMSVQKLQWLWIAEGFVCKSKSKSVEDLAEDCLMDLVGRNLVIVTKRRSNGKVKAFRVHDVVRDLCLMKAREEGFWNLVSAKDEPYASFDAWDYDIYDELLNPSDYKTYEDYRLCFHVNRQQFTASQPSGLLVRSLLYIAATDKYPRCPYDVAFIGKNFKRIGVLDLESINMGSSFENKIELLINLRYLGICGDMESIPPSLSKLQDLEILVVKGLKKKVVLPDTIWSMKKLRHVYVTDRAIFSLPQNGNSFDVLVRLVSLTFARFKCEEASDEMIARIPNLRELRCVVLGPRDASTDSCWLPAFKSLLRLEALKISYYGKVLNELKFPKNLKKLSLSNFRLPWTQISSIARLPNLEVLKLVSRAFEGSNWEMEEEFGNLKYLKLDTLDIVHWDMDSNYFPQLEQLVVRNCKQLDEIPLDFHRISTLLKIEVQQCEIRVEESLKRIAEQEVEGLKIVINNSYSA